MKSFNEIYNTICSKNHGEMEQKRLKNVKTLKIGIGIAILLAIIVFVLPIPNPYKAFMPSLFVFVMFFGAAIFIATSAFNKRNTLRTEYKSEIIKDIVNGVFEDAKYSSERGISSEIYNVRLMGGDYDEYSSEDLIEVPSKKCVFSEVLTQREHRDSDGNKSYSTVFSGLAGKCELCKTVPRMILKSNGLFFEKSRVKLDMSEFEKYFDVAADDKILAMRILTADVMAIIVKMRKEIKVPFELGVKGTTLYFRLCCGAMFEPSLFKSVTDLKTLYKYYSMLVFINEITEKIDKLLKEMEI